VLAPALEQPVSLERNEVMVHGARGCQADGIGDLTNRGWIPPLLDGLRDAIEDPLAPFLVMPGHVLAPFARRAALRVVRPTVAERMF
jgi:hypothetical protein